MTMISLKRIFVLLALCAVAFGQDHNEVTGDEEIPKIEPRTVVHEVNLNKAFDKALPKIRSFMYKHGFDPMNIPDIELPLGPLPGLTNSKMLLHHGHMQGLTSIYRTGDISLQYSKKRISLYMNIGFDIMDLSHEYAMKLLLFTRRGDCYGRYKNVEAKMLVDFEFKDYQVHLKFFEFVNVGDFKLRLEGNLADGLLNLVSKIVTKLFRTKVLREIEAKAHEVIDEVVQDINEMIPAPCKIDGHC